MATTLARCRIGIVPIVFRGHDRSPEEIAAVVAELGFEGIQSIDTSDPEALAGLVADHGLGVAEVYAALPASATGPTKDALDVGRARLRLLDELRGDVLVVALDGTTDRDRRAGRATDGATPRLSAEGMARLADLLDTLAVEASALGRRLAFHPHVGTYVETPGEVEDLLDATERDGVELCLDVGHHLVGGGDPLEAIRRYGERLGHVHLKDVDGVVLESLRSGRTSSFSDAVEEVVFCPLGDGVLPLDDVLSALDAVGYRGWLMVEQDSTAGDPVGDSRRSLTRLRACLREGE